MNTARVNGYVDLTVEPPLETWGPHATGWHRPLDSSFPTLGSAIIPALRAELTNAAVEYTRELAHRAAQAGIPHPAAVAIGEGTRLLMTGHQPIIFHSGLVFKYEQVDQLSRRTEIPAVAVSLDTDEGDGGVFAGPVPRGSTDPYAWHVAGCENYRLATESKLFFNSRVIGAHDVTQVFDRVASQLSGCGHSDAVAMVREVGRWYAALEDTPIAAAHAITRRAAGIGTQLVELPTSRLFQLPSARSLVASWISQATQVVRWYNESLDEFRATRGIKNQANPFPNLSLTDDQVELPFWIIRPTLDSRAPLHARCTPEGIELRALGEQIGTIKPDEPCLPTEALIVPRGALVSLFFRVYMSDFFVHGLGGRTYDSFTDELIRAALNISAPAFGVASASRYVFSEERSRLADLQQWSDMERDLVHHSERYLDQNIFSPKTVAWLSERMEEKEKLVARLRENKQHGRSAAEEGQRLEELQKEVKRRVMEDMSTKLTALNELPESARQAINHRGYPWFFFSQASATSGAPT